MIRHISRWALALGLAAMGILHFTHTRGFRGLIPEWAKKATGLDENGIIIASGSAELALATGLLTLPRERSRMGWAAAAFFVAVFPGNIQQWRRGWSAPGLDSDTKRFVRLFLQPVLIAWALWSTSTPRRTV